ncbi:protein-export membrane protein SecF [Candidatus Uhrbacteria bacterium RIFCSPHIGHO2_01_FULL_63_20]|uniref:Protein-export membrane protein SecF n=1 Tax=Candidatus Uhrbacteria bacterium RIFCSPHIGHO2_01_FULL_63_20 TaxID=1802385 RepID=A0A1F7TLB4_9BACT|nr:MAG: protein-export membrane protein SecF [Candidatus Uhrbacteria bacterium RIFCSPHIGHO2_01_FULL_63_20]
MAFSFIRTRRAWFTVSFVSIGLSILALAAFGLKFGTDFTGGTLLELSFALERPVNAELAATLEGAGFPGSTVQQAGEDRVIVRLPSLSEGQHQTALSAIRNAHGEFEELRFNSVGPVVGAELQRSAIIGVLVTLLLIGLYIALAFRKVGEQVNSWKYAIIVLFTAAHDVIIPLGLFAVLGRVWHWEVGAAFVAAILTILGYSISDTVVVFDRVRENLGRDSSEPFDEVVDRSVRQTAMRSVNTSVTTLLALAAILAFGGDTTRPFALALFAGIATGTYSSIFIASPLLVEWEKRPRKG